jgi:hypothetical protein
VQDAVHGRPCHRGWHCAGRERGGACQTRGRCVPCQRAGFQAGSTPASCCSKGAGHSTRPRSGGRQARTGSTTASGGAGQTRSAAVETSRTGFASSSQSRAGRGAESACARAVTDSSSRGSAETSSSARAADRSGPEASRGRRATAGCGPESRRRVDPCGAEARSSTCGETCSRSGPGKARCPDCETCGRSSCRAASAFQTSAASGSARRVETDHAASAEASRAAGRCCREQGHNPGFQARAWCRTAALCHQAGGRSCHRETGGSPGNRAPTGRGKARR